MGALTPSWRRSVVAPAVVGVIAAVVTGYVLWQLVRADVAHWAAAGFKASPELYLVLFFSGVAGVAAFWLARRMFRGPRLTCRGWTLGLLPTTPQTTGYRSARVPSIQDLVARLEGRGYRPAIFAVDLDGNQRGSLDTREPLAGASFCVTDARLGPPPANVVVRLSAAISESPGLGTIQARDVSGAGYEELATFVIAELDVLVPGVTYLADESALTPDPAAELRGVLPDVPRALPGP